MDVPLKRPDVRKLAAWLSSCQLCRLLAAQVVAVGLRICLRRDYIVHVYIGPREVRQAEPIWVSWSCPHNCLFVAPSNRERCQFAIVR